MCSLTGVVPIAGGLGLEALETATGQLLLLTIEVDNISLPKTAATSVASWTMVLAGYSGYSR